MKKVIALLLVCMLCFALVACGDSDDKSSDSSSTSSSAGGIGGNTSSSKDDTDISVSSAPQDETEADDNKDDVVVDKSTESDDVVVDTSTESDDIDTPDNGSGGLDEFLQSAAGKQAVESFKNGAEAGGNCTADCYAEGDTLVLEAKLTTQIPDEQVSLVSSTLEEYMEQDTFDSTMKSLVSLLKSNTSCDDPHVKVKYLNADGSVLAEKSY